MKTSLCAYWSTLELVLATLFCFTNIFLKIKQHRLKLCICRIQCTLPPFPQYAIPLIPSEQKAVLVAMHMSVGGGRQVACKLPAATLKRLDGLLLLGLAGFFPRWGVRAHTMSMFAAWILLAFIYSIGLPNFGFVSLFFFPFLTDTLESCCFLSALGRFGLVSN